MNIDGSDWKVRIVLTVLAFAAIVCLNREWASSAGTELSLQLRREQQEEAPPPEEPLEDKAFARFDRSFGGFGLISGYLDNPLDMVVDKDEILYVLDTGNNRIQRFDPFGSYLSKFGEKGSDEGQFDSPTAIEMDNAGFLYVVDSGNHRIQKFDESGDFILQWGSIGSGEGLFNGPRDIAFDGDNNAYVADPENDRIQIFTSRGNFIAEWNKFTLRKETGSHFDTIISLAYEDERFGYILALSSEGIVQRFKLDGNFQESFEVKPRGECLPARILVDNQNYIDKLIYIADKVGNRILRYNKDGVFQGELKEGEGPFLRPEGLFIDREHKRFFVVDTGHNKIQKFYMR